ncbi:MAG: zinc transporter ZntB [Kiritimatiellae bacterium]|jgi:zinc transporter|nr:zinc transporter ZntB [Kiritimatiellia bacterium]
MKDNSGFIFAFELNKNGQESELSFQDVKDWKPNGNMLWVHLDYKGNDAVEWLSNGSGVSPIIVEALTTEETRPRSLVHNGGMMLILRGVNMHSGANPEDMISVRMWVDTDLVITLSHRVVIAIEELRQDIERGTCPTGPAAFIEDLSDRMAMRMGVVISDIEDDIDELEDEVITSKRSELRSKIGDARRSAIAMRRYLAPQRDVMTHLYNEKVDWMPEMERMRLREISDRTTRYVEDLDTIRERATVMQEELNNYMAEQMNKTMYVLAMVAGIFLPLGFLTGLLGINVGGIPGADNKHSFVIFCIILLGIASLQLWFFKRKKMM